MNETQSLAKHTITREDLEFLKSLQHEMNTQDHVGQAAPRFWAIKDYRKVWSDEEGDRQTIFLEDGCEGLDNLGEVADHIDDNWVYYVTKNYDNTGIMSDEHVESLSLYDCNSDEEFKEGLADETLDATFEIDSMEEAAEWLNDNGDNCVMRSWYMGSYIRPDTLFLTLKGAKEHLEANYYHYHEKAHPYAMTAWRSPEVERLWDIIQSVDWNNV